MIAVLGSCALGDRADDAEALVEHFTESLDDQDVGGAASLTSYPNAASASIQQMFDGLHPQDVDYKLSQFITLDDESGFFSLDVAWDFGKERKWEYNVQGSVRKLAVGWRIQWDPSVVVPDLGHGRTVNFVRTDAPPPRVLNSAGEDLMTEQAINAVTLDPARMPDPVATTTAVSKAIESVAPLITSQTLMQELVVAQGQPITAVRLRDADFEILEPDLTPIPGVVVEKEQKLISADRRIVSPMLDAVRNVWQANRDATAGWAVQLLQPGQAPTQLAGFQGPAGPDVQTTLDANLQLAAEDAVVSVGTPAAIVALSPSSGGILAVAQNSYANDEGPIAFTDAYPAGSGIDTFKQAAALEQRVPVGEVKADDALDLAGRLGLGVDYSIPGLEEVTANNPQLGGSGKLAATPFGMAVVAASIARGGLAMPMITVGQPATTPTQMAPLRPDVIDRLRVLMREGVARPEAESLRQFPDVAGIPMSAGDDQWFIATKGDLAFAVFIKDADGADQAAKMASRLLRAMARPQA
ncbi:NTF2-like N-terminal transpeptidase domain-containing protein [Antrihabitans sp. YC2-6]|uniref:NTF2-like N-terminal transpeptidase domain-containing protein n=1 Tax=Antrihabitans sp. YC2-6 TaxID=2799498 RepID=UPI0027DD0C5B|nr:NTF2-like N-terminal transpeptidase domain-containing protein [Antrihabitans sp. YC2-6]